MMSKTNISETMKHTDLAGSFAGSFTLPGTSMTVNRMGYGAMQLPGPQVWGPPGTSSVEHLRENLRAATLQILPDVLADLNAIGRGAAH